MNKIIQHIISNTTLREQEAWWMLESITNKTKEKLITSFNELSSKDLQTVNLWIKKITVEHMPLAYLIGWTPFLDLKIYTNPPILIPRPETEEWVDTIIRSLTPHANSVQSILDIGTGSGCIALALAKHFPQASIIATDINHSALLLAQENAIKNNINNITFIQSNLFENISNQTFDLIVSNPPYIDPIDKQAMMPEVTKWEDSKALFANNQGLEIVEKIMNQASQYLSLKRELPYQLVLEYGYNQKESILALAQQYQWNCSIYKDLFGNFRTARLSIHPLSLQ